jgi:hypothetical protein
MTKPSDANVIRANKLCQLNKPRRMQFALKLYF